MKVLSPDKNFILSFKKTQKQKCLLSMSIIGNPNVNIFLDPESKTFFRIFSKSISFAYTLLKCQTPNEILIFCKEYPSIFFI